MPSKFVESDSGWVGSQPTASVLAMSKHTTTLNQLYNDLSLRGAYGVVTTNYPEHCWQQTIGSRTEHRCVHRSTVMWSEPAADQLDADTTHQDDSVQYTNIDSVIDSMLIKGRIQYGNSICGVKGLGRLEITNSMVRSIQYGNLEKSLPKLKIFNTELVNRAHNHNLPVSKVFQQTEQVGSTVSKTKVVASTTQKTKSLTLAAMIPVGNIQISPSGQISSTATRAVTHTDMVQVNATESETVSITVQQSVQPRHVLRVTEKLWIQTASIPYNAEFLIDGIVYPSGKICIDHVEWSRRVNKRHHPEPEPFKLSDVFSENERRIRASGLIRDVNIYDYKVEQTEIKLDDLPPEDQSRLDWTPPLPEAAR